MGKRNIVNTEKRAKENPGAVIGEALVFGSSNAIYRQEAEGQTELVESACLPAQGFTVELHGRVSGGKIVRDPIESPLPEIKVLGPVDGDDLFVRVELPPGWKKRVTDHSLHSELVDDKGRVRGGMFYKAAFYDRRAHFRPQCRFQLSDEHQDDKDWKSPCRGVVKKDGIVVHTGEWHEGEEGSPGWSKAIKDAEVWLHENYPDYRDPKAYWDID